MERYHSRYLSSNGLKSIECLRHWELARTFSRAYFYLEISSEMDSENFKMYYEGGK